MDWVEFSSGKPSPRRELQGPRPSPLRVRKDSHKIKVPPIVPQPSHHHPDHHQQQQQQQRKPIIIYTVSPKLIHTNASEFMSVVQRLAGFSTAASTSTFASPSNDAISPAARFATIENTKIPLEGEKKRYYDNMDVVVDEFFEETTVERTGSSPCILSPIPSSLPVVPPNFFSPPSDHSMYYSFINPQGNVSDRRNEVPAKTNEEIITHSYDSTTESKDHRKNHDTGSMDSKENRGTESVEPRKNWDTDSMDRGKSRVTDSMEPRKNWNTDSMDRGKSRVTDTVEPRKNWDTDSMDRGKSRVTDSIHILEEPLISYGPKTPTSIDDLPTHLQKCLLYVSLFPRNYNFEKEIVVQMWIAVGYIKSEGKKLMEDTAGGYFDEILSMSLFELSPLDESSYILPDDAYNMIQEFAGAEAEYARLEDGNLNGISRRTLHSSVLYESTVDPMVFKSFNKLKELHSLLLLHENRRYITKIPYDLMLSLRCIRVLDLSGTQLTELPSSVGDMKTLHYLDLSGTRVRSLPGSISGLSSLQVLRLRDCLDFVELPKNMKNIINLRHLDLDIIRQLTFMPPRMGRLTKLQTLSAFIARKERGFQIAELKKMINLRGSLSIVKLENVGPLEEAEEAALCDKEYLHKLVFQWSMPCLNAEEVLQGLEPNQNLTDLEIICYGGSTFPAWLGDSTFSKLSNIHIYNCKNGIILPFLGRLPSLKTLRIAEMHTLDGIDDQFSRGSSSTGFPKLETLEFDGMHAWKEWTGLAEEEMPRLHTLTIADCPNLVSLPGLSNLKSLQHLEISSCFKLLSLAEERLPTSLQTLIITDCPHLKEVYQKEAVDWHKIEDVPNVWIDYQHIC